MTDNFTVPVRGAPEQPRESPAGPSQTEILRHYENLRRRMAGVAAHWPKLSSAKLAILTVRHDSALAVSAELEAQAGKKGEHPWRGWWQTTDAVHADSVQEPLVGLSRIVGAAAAPVLLDGEWTDGRHGNVSLQVRHVGNAWAVTRLVEGDGEPALALDVSSLARAAYGESLTHRIYFCWDARRARIAPFAARLLELSGVKPASAGSDVAGLEKTSV